MGGSGLDAKFFVQTAIMLVIAIIAYLLKDKMSQVEKAQGKLDETVGNVKKEFKAEMDGLKAAVKTDVESIRKDVVGVDRNLLEYKTNVTDKFAALTASFSEKFVLNTSYAKDSVTTQNQIRSLEHQIHKKSDD